MKQKFLEILKDKVKDFGLSDKAIDELVEMGIEGLTAESSDEDFTNNADKLVPFAKMMQREITRKTSKKTIDPKPSEGEGNKGEGAGKGDEIPAWAKALQESVDALTKENAELKASAKANERKQAITAKAKELGIPSYLVEKMAFAEDADINAELTDLKQKMVTENLLPKNAVIEKGTEEAKMKEDADSWAKNLPDK